MENQILRKGEIAQRGRDAERILTWLGWADKDYLASRRLLLGGFLPQGAALANTAIEKYFKALLQMAGRKVPRVHDIRALHETLANQHKALVDLNRSFLGVLYNSYKLRYPDDLKVGFSLSLSQAKLLVETDSSVHRIRSGFKFARTSGRPVGLTLDTELKAKNPDLVEKNCYFGDATRQSIFEQLLDCYEMRIIDGGSILEVSYRAVEVLDDGQHPLEGLIPGPQKAAK